jgi:para-aminobenzoate synthetase component 1
MVARQTTPTGHQAGSLCEIVSQPYTVWLDSTLRLNDRGQASLLGRNPALEVILENGTATVGRPGLAGQRMEGEDGLAVLEKLVADQDRLAVGYLGFEATLPFAGVTPKYHPKIPQGRFLLYDSVLQIDHDSGLGSVSNPAADDYADLLTNSGRLLMPIVPTLPPALATPVIGREDYLERVQRIKDHIREGDIYQANFTTRIDVESAADPTQVYARLREMSPAPYSAFLNFGDYQILSSSPERMFTRHGDHLTTGPIKGTIARGTTPAQTVANRRRLLESAKDRAELLMIVDLERNDLGRIARIGSVTVENLFRPEVYATVIHLVSDISARLRPEIGLSEICRALLPGGSITGVPKKRALEIINEMETTARSVYTGCVGYLDSRRADFNIAIRTMVHQGGTYHVHAGGGIVADSNPQAEHDEMVLKATAMLRALGIDAESVAW